MNYWGLITNIGSQTSDNKTKMAEGRDLRASILLASDEAFDYPCTFCADNDNNSEAVLGCNDCSKLICGSCTALHSQLFKAHIVLDKTQVDVWQVQKIVHEDMCEQHYEKVLDMFCHDHDQLCCYVCVCRQITGK